MKTNPCTAPATLLLAALLLGLLSPGAGAVTPREEAPTAWWQQVKDDWDEAWDRAWADQGQARERDWRWDDGDADEERWLFDGPASEEGSVRFRYHDAGYAAVALTGDWLDWGELPLVLSPDAGEWEATVAVSPGRHHYRFIVSDEEGEWEAIDPDNSEALRLDERGWVSVLEVSNHGIRLHLRERRQERWRLRREFEQDHGEEDVGLGYQRVDGLILGFAPDYLGETDFEPSAKGEVAYGFESERWTLGLTVLQPLAPRNLVWLKLRATTGTAQADRTGIGDLENSLAAAFLREDYRDYFKREGVAFSLVTRARPWLRVEAGLRSEDHASLANTASWSVHSGRFRPNLPADEGTLRSVFGALRLGRSSNTLELDWERAGEDVLGGDFGFSLIEATWRSRLPLGPRQRLDLRVKGGSNLRGSLPLQRRYLLGGLGTVRGYDYQSLLVADPAADPLRYGGERMVLANAEYGFRVNTDLDLYGLYDAGMAWADRDADLELGDLRDSAGLGLGLDDSNLRLNVMRALDGSKDLVWELRLERSF